MRFGELETLLSGTQAFSLCGSRPFSPAGIHRTKCPVAAQPKMTVFRREMSGGRTAKMAVFRGGLAPVRKQRWTMCCFPAIEQQVRFEEIVHDAC
ncbi:hypothetical protein BH20VER2_BH20VER2_09990 [soil metagenome]